MSDYRVKCTKFDFCWRCARDLAGGAYSALPDPLAVFMGSTFMGWGRGERKGWEKEERKGDERVRTEKGIRVSPPLQFYFDYFELNTFKNMAPSLDAENLAKL